MANAEQLQILKSGVEEWNIWRRDHPKVRVDLSDADLSCTDLIKADLSGADLIGADLSEANLSEANLSEANLTGANLSFSYLGDANLSDANLGGANLSFATLRFANLGGANLSDANLGGANLGGASLSEANLSIATLAETVFGNVNLSSVVGLDSCSHVGPSTLDHRTLMQSGPLPLVFLRGCGLPDDLIEYLPSLRGAAVQFYSCFISYSSKDHALAERLYADLQNNNVRCWKADEDLKIGDPFRQRIDEAIRRHQKLLLLLSKHSVESDWVREEVESCLERERQEKQTVLFPVRLDRGIEKTTQAWAASIRRQRHNGDFCNWKNHDAYKRGFDRLLRDLRLEEAPGA